MQDNLRIAFVPSHREPFSEKWAIDMRKRALKALESMSKENNLEIVVPEESLTPKGLVRDDSDAEKVIELFKTKDLSGILIGTMTFGDEISAVTIAEKIRELPILLFGTKEGAFTEDGNRRSDSFCGTLSVASGLYRRGIPFSFLGICFPEEDMFSQGIKDFVRTCAAVKGFIGAKIGQVGPRPEEFETCAINEFPMIEQFAQRIVPISLVDIFHAAEKVGEQEVSQITEKIKQRANCEGIREGSIGKAARLELALKDFVKQKNLAGLAVQCWDAMQKIYGISSCLTMGRLTEQGIMTACEVDIHGTLAMLVQYLASRKETVPHFIDWTIEHQSKKNVFLAWHCGNAPQVLAAKDSPVCLRAHSILGPAIGLEKSEGTAEFRLKPGAVTLTRIVEYDGQFKMLITKGTILASKDKLRGSGCWVEVPDLNRLYRTLIEEGFTHHASMIHGDINSSLIEFCRFTGIEPIVV